MILLGKSIDIFRYLNLEKVFKTLLTAKNNFIFRYLNLEKVFKTLLTAKTSKNL